MKTSFSIVEACKYSAKQLYHHFFLLTGIGILTSFFLFIIDAVLMAICLRPPDVLGAMLNVLKLHSTIPDYANSLRGFKESCYIGSIGAGIVPVLLSTFISSIFSIASIRVCLDLYDKGSSSWVRAFSYSWFALKRYLVVVGVYVLAGFLGFFLFIIPGVISLLLHSFVTFIVIEDPHLTIRTIFRQSRALIRPVVGKFILVWGAVLIFHIFYSYMLNPLILILWMPLNMLVTTYMYRKLQQRVARANKDELLSCR